MVRSILHCDMNNFYASVECMLDTSLRGKPIAVGGDAEERHGIILAKNYKAKAFGIQTGEALWQARQKCKDLIIVPPHYEQYLKYSKLARQIYSDYTDQIEPYGMDECWLDVSGSGIIGNGETIANEIRERMKFELGLTISVGVSFNKIFAKLGSDMKKPDAVTVIPQESFREKIWNLPASDMLGVGRATEKKLSGYGIHTIGELARMPEEYVQSWFGKCGSYIWQYANGLDQSRVMQQDYEVPAKTVGHGITAMQDLENNAEVWNIMLELTQDIGHKLRTYSKYASGVAINIRDNELNWKQWQCPLEMSTHSSAIIAQTAFHLFERSYRWDRPIRSVTVRAINLVSQSQPQQLDLFTDATQIDRREKLETAVESIRERFGKHSIMPATLCQDIHMSREHNFELIMPSGMLGA